MKYRKHRIVVIGTALVGAACPGVRASQVASAPRFAHAASAPLLTQTDSLSPAPDAFLKEAPQIHYLDSGCGRVYIAEPNQESWYLPRPVYFCDLRRPEAGERLAALETGSPQFTDTSGTLPDSDSSTTPNQMIRVLLCAAVPSVEIRPILTVPSLSASSVASPGKVEQSVAPTTVAPTRVAPTKIADGGADDTGPAPAPVMLSSRHEDQQMLAQLTADLNRANSRLNEANQAIGEGQRQLSSFTNVLQQAMMEDGSDASGLHPFVRVALRYAGTPYVWGGESKDGFDCSGFIIRVMRDLGYEAPPHSAAEQFNCGKPIAQELLKPGDLVFFANTYKPGVSHVGIYLGRRQFIQAAGTGKGTIVSSLDDPHYQAKYAGARRLIAAHGN